MWIIMPIIGMALSYFTHGWVKRTFFDHSEARKRIIIFIPYQISFSFSIMFFVAVTKNYYFYAKSRDGAPYLILYFVSVLIFPLVALISARYYMLRRGRSLNKYSKSFQAVDFLKDEPSFYGRDMIDSL